MSYFGLKSTPSGLLLCQEVKTNNLLLLEPNFSEKFRYPGEIADEVPFNKFRQPHFSFEGKKIMWFGGKTTLYTVDLRDMSILKIKNLLPEVMLGQGSTPEPMYALADFDKEKYIATYFYTDEFVLSYVEKNREADIHLMSDIFPKMHEVTCMDLDREKVFAFIGGNTVKEENS